MLFNSIDFAIFLPLVFGLYWFVTQRNFKLQNLLIVFSSFVFYGWWDWRFLFLIVFSLLVDFIVGLRLASEENPYRRKVLLWVSIVANLGLLGFFKYHQFFVDNFVAAFTLLGQPLQVRSLDLILPVGISFYTFQTMSYTIDVYRRKIEPTQDLVAFAAYVSFFPQLVAGPIERAADLLPQFFKQREFRYDLAVDGMRQILWGLIKKVVIADNCAYFANQIFFNSEDLNGSSLLLGGVFFMVQIYGDFSGYSDIAIGTARLFGFRLSQNFAFPYFSRNVAEFWRRWHISLSTWFRDYVYEPMGGNRLRSKPWVTVRNNVVLFLLIGFWHGPKWTFIVFGLLNALFFLPLFLAKKPSRQKGVIAKGRLFPTLKEARQMILFNLSVLLGIIFFRADDLPHAFSYIGGIFSPSLFEVPDYAGVKKSLVVLAIVAVFMVLEWLGRENQYAIEKTGLEWKKPFRMAFYYALVFCLFYFAGPKQDFVYFQF
jgi:D-alanyl-lipoteichoic acid acyltransferase DltB (MBOAT superfamily)